MSGSYPLHAAYARIALLESQFSKYCSQNSARGLWLVERHAPHGCTSSTADSTSGGLTSVRICTIVAACCSVHGSPRVDWCYHRCQPSDDPLPVPALPMAATLVGAQYVCRSPRRVPRGGDAT